MYSVCQFPCYVLFYGRVTVSSYNNPRPCGVKNKCMLYRMADWWLMCIKLIFKKMMLCLEFVVLWRRMDAAALRSRKWRKMAHRTTHDWENVSHVLCEYFLYFVDRLVLEKGSWLERDYLGLSEASSSAVCMYTACFNVLSKILKVDYMELLLLLSSCCIVGVCCSKLLARLALPHNWFSP